MADPAADAAEALRLYGIEFADVADVKNMDAVILAVAHDQFKGLTVADFDKFLFSIIPPELFNLYFFDGEKIADPTKSFEIDALQGEGIIVKRGKKNFRRVFVG